MMVLRDSQLENIATRYEEAGEYIVGFLYGELHEIRDIRKPWNSQSIWMGYSDDAYHRQLKIEYMRCAMEGIS